MQMKEDEEWMRNTRRRRAKTKTQRAWARPVEAEAGAWR
jgi:hypothetical protein